MKLFITFILVTSFAYAIRQNEEKLKLTNPSQTIYTNQHVQIKQSSFSPLYLHVFEVVETGPAKHLNLTEKFQNEIMRIESFELIEDKGISFWVAYLKKKNDDKKYVCEIKQALLSNEIIL